MKFTLSCWSIFISTFILFGEISSKEDEYHQDNSQSSGQISHRRHRSFKSHEREGNFQGVGHRPDTGRGFGNTHSRAQSDNVGGSHEWNQGGPHHQGNGHEDEHRNVNGGHQGRHRSRNGAGGRGRGQRFGNDGPNGDGQQGSGYPNREEGGIHGNREQRRGFNGGGSYGRRMGGHRNRGDRQGGQEAVHDQREQDSKSGKGNGHMNQGDVAQGMESDNNGERNQHSGGKGHSNSGEHMKHSNQNVRHEGDHRVDKMEHKEGI